MLQRIDVVAFAHIQFLVILEAQVVRTMLQNMGHSVEISWDGSECLERLFDANGKPRHAEGAAAAGYSGLAYDLILMDCNMPIMDGYEACQVGMRTLPQIERMLTACSPHIHLMLAHVLPVHTRDRDQARLHAHPHHRPHRLCDGGRPRKVSRVRHD